jgi:four helix bundle protein
MSPSPVARLDAHQAAVALAHALFPTVRAWPPFERFSIGMQLVRAAESIGANIAESTGRTRPAEQLRYLRIARASFNETQHWIKRAQAEHLLGSEVDELLARAGKTLNGLIRYRQRIAKR